jgi:PKD repeat protein
MQYIWQRVAEDFAAFDVNVTTEQPSADKLTRSGSTDAVFGTTALITNSNGVYSCSCGGVAYVGIFDDSDFYKPALVFYNQLGSGNEKYVAEAISHEVGHNLGLLHDGTSTTGYYEGHGSGTTGWAPIMGVGYSRNLVQWSKGEYAGANQKQDDYVVMGQNGLAHRADDHGSTFATATLLAGTAANGATTLAATGMIERPTDVDVFAFTAGAGAASFGLAPAARSANLDAQLDLHDAAGQLLARVNPLEALNATVSTTLPSAGTYYLSVRGVGKGDPLTTGYTNYGSLGQYALTGTVQSSTAGQPPVAAITASPPSGTAPLTVSFSADGSSDPDGSIVSYAWTFGDGSVGSGETASNTYQSGTYTAVLTVTDNAGLTAQRSVTITAQAPVAVVPMRVADIAMGLTRAKTQARATAAVKVTDSNGNVVPGATVAGSWSGLTTGAASVVTASNGVATFTSANTRAKGGTFTFTVMGVTLSGYAYDNTLNLETTNSISY